MFMRSLYSLRFVMPLLCFCLIVSGAQAEKTVVNSHTALPDLKQVETITLPGNVPLQMVWIPAGTFLMGRYANEQDAYSNENPQHQVVLSQGVWMGKYVVTKEQWRTVMGTEPRANRKYVSNAPKSPAVCITWDDVQVFIAKLNACTGKVFRLPYEAEWEYACRAGTTTRFYWGDDRELTAIDAYAWWRGTALLTKEKYARPVGLKRPNPWGLFDMGSNVFEWCQDWYGVYPNGPVTDPTGPVSGIYRVQRGGSWIDYGNSCRSAHRIRETPSVAKIDAGFRLVLER